MAFVITPPDSHFVEIANWAPGKIVIRDSRNRLLLLDEKAKALSLFERRSHATRLFMDRSSTLLVASSAGSESTVFDLKEKKDYDLANSSFIYSLAISRESDTVVFSRLFDKKGEVVVTGFKERGTPVETFRCSSGPVSSVAFSSTLVMVGAKNGDFEVWDRKKKMVVYSRQMLHMEPILFLVPSPDEAVVVTGGFDEQMHVLSTRNFDQVHRIHGFSGTLQQVRYSPDGRFLALSATDSPFMLLDVKKNYSVCYTIARGKDIRSFAFLNENEVGLLGGNAVWILNLNDKRQRAIYESR